jgi:hypothetical protein
MKMLVKLKVISPNTIIERITVIVFNVIVNRVLFDLFLNTILKENSANRIEKIMSVQKPTNEISVNNTIER